MSGFGFSGNTFGWLFGGGGGGGSGTVTSVGLTMPSSDFDVANSPVTTSGTLAVTYKTQGQNLVFASPNGSTGVPTFRALTTNDLPNTVGTVKSVGLTMPSSDFDVANSPVTTSGTLVITYKTQTQNLFFASPNGSNGVPTFRAITTNDLPNTVGTVKSVGLTMPSSDFDVANSPVTTSGTLAVTYKTQAQNLVFASPNGSTGVPTFRAITTNDLPININSSSNLFNYYNFI